MPKIELEGWIQVDLLALAADAGLSLIGVRKLLKSKWIAGEIDLKIVRNPSAHYYVKAPSARRVLSADLADNQQAHLPRVRVCSPDRRRRQRQPGRLGEIVTRECFLIEADYAHYQWCVQQLRQRGLDKTMQEVAAALRDADVSAA